MTLSPLRRLVTLVPALLTLSLLTVPFAPGCDPGVKDTAGPDPADADGDGHNALDHGGDDCDDANPNAWPGATEYCNGRDDDCDGSIDELGEGGVADAYTFYLDQDGDTYGASELTTLSCTPVEGYVALDGDCDDSRPVVNPGAEERCNGFDDNCDGAVDTDSVDALPWYLDADLDGWGTDTDVLLACDAQPGRVGSGGDCDDADASIHPKAPEYCGGIDHDCDSLIDEPDSLDALSVWTDADGDTYGDPVTLLMTCVPVKGMISEGGDCDDTNAEIHPNAAEPWGSEIDLDCDGDTFGESALLLADRSLLGDSLSGLGRTLGSGQDLDGDGIDELIVGGARGALLFSAPWEGELPAPDADASFLGVAGDSSFEVDLLPDLGADGWPEIALAESSESGSAVWLLSGIVSGEVDLASQALQIQNPDGGIRVGFRVVGAGDPGGDGQPDLLLADPEASGGLDAEPGSGVIWLFDGPVSSDLLVADARASFVGERTGSAAGQAIASVGDQDGDSFDDLLVGAPSAQLDTTYLSGRAYLLRGPLSGVLQLADADSILTRASEGDFAGELVAGAGDVNGDGFPDMLIGAGNGAGGRGAAWLLFGPLDGDRDLAKADATIEGQELGDYAGGVSIAAGDLDGDGFADLLIGAPNRSDSSSIEGAVYLVMGPTSGLIDLGASDATFLGGLPGSLTGYALALGDLDGDSQQDLLIGAPGDSRGGEQAGAVGIFLWR